jgi:hypothetical protein
VGGNVLHRIVFALQVALVHAPREEAGQGGVVALEGGWGRLVVEAAGDRVEQVLNRSRANADESVGGEATSSCSPNRPLL